MRALLRTAAAVFRRDSGQGTSAHADAVTPLLQSALALHHAGRFEEAIPLCRKALELDPSADAAHNLLGAVLCAGGNLAEGEASFRRAVQANPSNADAVNNLGNVRKDRGDFDGAEALYRRGLELQPMAAPIHVNLGLTYTARRRLQDAAECFRRAIALAPRDADAHNNLGTVLRMQGGFGEAEMAFRAALAVDPDHVEANCGLADVLQLAGLLEEAEGCCQRALAVRHDCADALNTLANIARARGDNELARSRCTVALRVKPAHIGALNTLAAIEAAQGDRARAETLYREALAHDPIAPVTRFNLGSALLMQGRYEEGFELYESRFEAFGRHAGSQRLNDRLHSSRRWQGESVKDKRLLLWAEQGLGDSLMMLRYAPVLRARGFSEVVLLCDESLARLAHLQKGVHRVLTSDKEVDGVDFDLHCPMMSLPRACGTTLRTVPAAVPYVDVPDEMVSAWHGRFKSTGPRIGLCWAGSPALRDDAKRSIPLERFGPLFSVPGVQWISLQKGPAAAQWAFVRNEGGWYIDECGDFLDTASLIAALDLVVSVDTAVAHLAGALNKPAWLLNRFESEWRWGLETTSTPWYPSVTIFREATSGGWASAIAEIAQRLESSLSGPPLNRALTRPRVGENAP